MPHLSQLQREYQDKNLTIIGMTSADSNNTLEQVKKMVTRLDKETGKVFNHTSSTSNDTDDTGTSAGKDMLLLSVRSGAAISMPGMMDTVLNLGLNDTTVKTLADAMNNEHFAWDSYRRYVLYI